MGRNKKRLELNRVRKDVRVVPETAARRVKFYQASNDMLTRENGRLCAMLVVLRHANRVLGEQNISMKRALDSLGEDWTKHVASLDLAELEERQLALIPRFIDEDSGSIG